LEIVRAEITSSCIPVERPHRMAIGTTRFQENVIVKLVAKDGTYGFGEAPHMVGYSQQGETPETVRVVLRHKLIPAVLGLSVFNQEVLAIAQDRAVPGNRRAKGAVLNAAFDLAGKLLGAPLHILLGGKLRDAIPLSWSIPIVDIKDGIDEARKMVEDGFRILKIKLGRSNPDQDIEMVRAIRVAVGKEISLRVDANQAYDMKTALRVIKNIEESGIDFFEQPVHMADIDGMAEVTRKSSIPIMADESAKSTEDLARIAKRRAADYVSIYVIGPGGLICSKKMASVAEAFGMRAYVGGALESIIGASAGLHLAASCPNIDLGCEMYGQFLLKDDLGTEPLSMRDGALVVPDEPGLGIIVDERKIGEYRRGEVEVLTLEKHGLIG
jgi:muconate cycloisomerase